MFGMRFRITLLFFLIVGFVSAQTDSSQVNYFYTQFWKFQGSDLSVASKYSDSLLWVSEEMDYNKGRAMAYECEAIIAIQQAKYKQATLLLKKQKKLNIALEDKYALATFHNRMAIVHHYQSFADSALFHWEKALVFFEKFQDTTLVIKTKNNMGAAIFSQGEYEKAFLLYKGVQEYLEENAGDGTDLVNCYNNIGLVFKNLQNYENAKKYYYKALKIVDEHNLIKQKARLLINIANIFKIEKKYKEAITLFSESKEIRESNGIPYGVLLSSIGECYFHLGRYEMSEKLYFEAQQHLLKSNEKSDLSISYARISIMYNEQNKYAKALDFRLKALVIEQEIGNENSLLGHYNAIIDISYHLKKYDLIKKYNELASSLKDSIFSKQIADKVYEVEFKYDLEKKEQKIDFLEQEAELAHKKEQNLWLILLLGFSLLCGIISLLIYRNQILTKNKIITDLEAKQRSMELQHSALLLAKRNEDVDKVLLSLKTIEEEPTKLGVQKLMKEMNRAKVVERNWEEYLNAFEKLNPLFYENLQKQGVHLTPSEKRLCALIIQKLTISQISNVLNHNSRSVEKARSRLRKKFALTLKDDLADFLYKLSEKV